MNRKRVARLMTVMGIEAVYPKRNLSRPTQGHRIYAYLLEGVAIERVNQVGSTDITHIRMAHGFVYLVAVMDSFSRFVLSWALSLTMELEFCLEAAWMRNYGKGRVFYSTFGHREDAWDRADVQKMWLEAIKWSMGLTQADATPRPRPAQ